MGDEKDPGAHLGPEPAVSAVPPPAPVSVVPRPVSVVPRPSGSGSLMARTPPPPLPRSPMPEPPPASAPPAAYRSVPPPPPTRHPPASDSSATLAARPSVMPRPPVTPPPPAHRASLSPPYARPPTQPPSVSATAQLEQRLGATQLELRKLGSERHTLRARLRRETDRLHELESALRAEKELRRQASDEHFTALSGVRARLSELEIAHEGELAALRAELAEARVEATAARRAAEDAERRVASAAVAAAAAPGAKAVVGLRRIRGIGPAYQRELSQLGVTRVQQVAAWTSADVAAFAAKLKIKPERIAKDDWVGQAQRLEPDAD